MSKSLSRRSMLKGSLVAAAAVSVPWTAKSWAAVVGANEDIRIATIGLNGRGKSHTDAWSKMKGVRLVGLCDCDVDVLQKEKERLMGGGRSRGNRSASAATKPSTRPTEEAQAAERPLQLELYKDLRKVIDSKDIDAVSIATPNHWHSLAAIWALQAGKDVYVEKPVSHGVWEGRQLVNAARKYDRICQTGTQSRSSAAIREAIDWVREGNIGKIKVSRGLCYKRRGAIGRAENESQVPGTVDYNLWSGPAAQEKPLHRVHFHYDWHWFWAYGNGDIGNQGIHQMDIARWALGKDHLSPKVFSVGGRFGYGYKDDGETPNTQFAVHDYGDSLLIFEVRGLPAFPGASGMDKYRNESVGNIIECEGGYVTMPEGVVARDNDDKVIKTFKDKGEDHFGNFIKAVRSRRREDLNADILEGHLSSALCHTSNISYRLGQEAKPREVFDAIKSDKAALETFRRFNEHLEMNDVSIVTDKATLGPVLTMDPKTERFEDNEDANKLLRRDYRAPFVVPESV
jgi:predicted dehydrogenase